MPCMMIRHRVAEFTQWKPVYDAHADVRRDAGLEEAFLLRDVDDPQQVVILFRTSDLARAKIFAQSADLREAMQNAGVLGVPEITLLHDVNV